MELICWQGLVIYLLCGIMMMNAIYKSAYEDNELMKPWELPTIILVWPTIFIYGFGKALVGFVCKLWKR